MNTLRNKMILQMQIKGHSSRTINTYTKCIIALAVHYNTSPDLLTTHLLEQGVSLPIIQQLLGHRSLRTTSVYLHIQQYSVYAVTSPLDTLSL